MKISNTNERQRTNDLSESEIKQLQNKIIMSQSYKLAYADTEFLASDDLRPLRLQLELLKPEQVLREKNIASTIVIFGSTRILSPREARKKRDEARGACLRIDNLLQKSWICAIFRFFSANSGAILLKKPKNSPKSNFPSLRFLFSVKLLELVKNKPCTSNDMALKKAQRQVRHSQYYQEAQILAGMVSREFQKHQRKDFVVVTGGGPGIMEAANRGAFNVGQPSVGFNITLDYEQAPNAYIDPDLCFQFQYFALRKMHFLLRAKALIAFPGGFGTLDEVFEVLTLVQTKKMQRLPIILMGKGHWQRVIDFEYLCQEGFISESDLALFYIVETAEQAIKIMCEFYNGQPPK